jgi:hypothetical protein
LFGIAPASSTKIPHLQSLIVQAYNKGLVDKPVLSLVMQKKILKFGGIDSERCDSGDLKFLSTLDPNQWVIKGDIKLPLIDEVKSVRVSVELFERLFCGVDFMHRANYRATPKR